MKKAIGILIFLFLCTLGIHAQKKHHYKKKTDFSIEQMAILKSKKMALYLDLSEKQQQEMKVLFMQKLADRKATQEKLKLNKKEGKTFTQEERFLFLKSRLDKQITFKKRAKRILDKDQYKRFEKMANHISTIKKNRRKKSKKHYKMKKDKV